MTNEHTQKRKKQLRRNEKNKIWKLRDVDVAREFKERHVLRLREEEEDDRAGSYSTKTEDILVKEAGRSCCRAKVSKPIDGDTYWWSECVP